MGGWLVLSASRRMLFNHADAWVVALIMATIAVVLHREMTGLYVLLIAAIAMGYWAAFAFNDYHDVPVDSLDDAKAAGNVFVSPGGLLATRGVAVSLLVAPIVLAAPVFALFGWRGIVALAISLLIMWVYSAPPLRLKSRPGPDLLVHCCFVETFPFVLVLFLIEAQWTALDVFLVTIAFLGSLSAQIEQQLRDYDVDLLDGDTFVIMIGRRRAYRLLVAATVALMAVAVVAFSQGVIPVSLVPFGLLVAPALFHRLLRGSNADRHVPLVKATVIASLAYFVLFLWLM